MRIALPLCLLAGLALFGCGSTHEDVLGGKDGPAAKIRSGSIVSLSPGTTELAAIVAPNYALVGRTSSCNWPMNVKAAPVVCDVKPNYEQIAAIKPAAIIYDASLFSPAEIEKLKASTQLMIPVKANTIAEFVDDVYKIGAITGEETEASTYADKILAAQSSATSDVFTVKPKVAIVLASATGNHLIAGTKSFQADAMRAAGVEPVGPDSAKFEPMNAEAMLQWNPDVIIFGAPLSGAEKAADALIKDPRLGSLEAIKRRRIDGLDEDIIVRRGARVDRLIELLHKRVKLRMGS